MNSISMTPEQLEPFATWLRLGKHLIAERPDGEVYVLESDVEVVARNMMRLSNERDSLRAALDKYGWHNHRCKAISEHSADVREPDIECTCGFDAALKENT